MEESAETDSDNHPNQVDDENILMERVEKEVCEITNDAETQTFLNPIQLSDINQSSYEEVTFDDMELYDLSKGEPINDLSLKIGGDEYPRYSCACHKLNLAIRHALAKHNTVCSIIRRINKSNAHIRRSINLARNFRLKKCRLRL